MDNAQTERSLLSLSNHIKEAYSRDIALSVVRHIPKVNLNQHLLSEVSPWNSPVSEFQLYFMRDEFSASAVICYLNKANMGIVKLRQL